MHLVLVPSELLHPRMAGIVVKPDKQSWEPSRDGCEENKQSGGIPKGRVTSEQSGRVSAMGILNHK